MKIWQCSVKLDMDIIYNSLYNYISCLVLVCQLEHNNDEDWAFLHFCLSSITRSKGPFSESQAVGWEWVLKLIITIGRHRTTRSLRILNSNLAYLDLKKVFLTSTKIEHIRNLLHWFITLKYADMWYIGLHLYLCPGLHISQQWAYSHVFACGRHSQWSAQYSFPQSFLER